MKIRLSASAAAYLRLELSYLRERSPAAAQRLNEDLKRLKRNLTQFPRMGKITDELLVPGVFRFVLGDYLVDYQVGEAMIDILVIRHGRQSPPNLAKDDDFDFEDPS